MTMEMILKHPDYFAAAYPICEAFQDQYISDEQIESIKDMPIWFTYAKTDRTVNPELCTEATVARLIEAGAKNIHVSAFEDVHDTTGRFTNADGTPYTYDGHWSWVYFDNNECYDENGVNAWQWLAKQTKAKESVIDPDNNKPSDSINGPTSNGSTSTGGINTGDSTYYVPLVALMALAASGIYVGKRKEF